MIRHLQSMPLDPGQRAALIYAQARSELSNKLWQAALGDGATRDARPVRGLDSGEMGLNSLVALLDRNGLAGLSGIADPSRLPADIPLPRSAYPQAHDERDPADGDPADEDGARRDDTGRAVGGLGANTGYAGTLGTAAERTGLPAPALAAIVHAEAACGPDGRWQAYSRNPHSSAAGLGQFLSGTWISESERPGTWLHSIAEQRGWLNEGGRVQSQARAPLLALRYDGDTSIQAIADYALFNLSQLRASGVAIDGSVEGVARGAYVGHHLGLKDAVRFLKGDLDPDRARHLLKAQIGAGAAAERIAETGDPIRAHRDWLLSYISRNVRPTQYLADFKGVSSKSPVYPG